MSACLPVHRGPYSTTLVVGKVSLSKPNMFRRDFDQFVVFDKFKGKFERHLGRGEQVNRVVST